MKIVIKDWMQEKIAKDLGVKVYQFEVVAISRQTEKAYYATTIYRLQSNGLSKMKTLWVPKSATEQDDVGETYFVNSYEEAADIAKKTIGIVDDAPVREKRYFVKESWIFNLEAMHDKLWVIADSNKDYPIEIAGIICNDANDVMEIRQKAEQLEAAAKRKGGVTGKEYGEIKKMVCWRVEARYCACISAGMSESEAGQCFEDI